MASTSTTPTRESAVVDLLSSLLRMRTWFREADHQWSDGQRTASLAALALLERHGPARVGELAERARVDASVFSRQTAHLEQAGFVRRDPDPTDGRAHRLSLSPEGARFLDTERSRVAAGVDARLDTWTADDIEEAALALRRLLAALAG